ncbi:MAG: NAD-dependent epimerase/dehydratase family protein [Nocardioidaceae bacterium]|nr:NAD-dependent epimerase/dehydratase family protein [Nocardioidaceae bacterium]
MRVVVVGASGNIGTALLEKLEGEAAVTEVAAVARRLPPVAPTSPTVTWHRGDIATDDLDPLLRGADVVVHLAWLFQPTHRPSSTWANNAVGTARLLEAVERSQAKALVVATSVAAYSPRQDDQLVDESWPTHGASTAAYAREKAYVERLLDAFKAQVKRCVVTRLRPAFVFHRRTATQQRRLFMGPLVPGSLVRPSLIPVLPTPAGLLLQTVHSDDVGSAIASAVVAGTPGAFNICADGVLTPRQLAELFNARQATVPARLARAALKAAWTAHAVPANPELLDALLAVPMMSNARAKAEWDWVPTVSAVDALGEFFEGLRRGEAHPTPPLDADTGGRLRTEEFGTGVGSRP